VSGSGSASNLQIPIFGICPSGRNRLSSAKNKIPRFWSKPEAICGMIGDVMPAASVFLPLIADFVVYLGLLIRPRKAIAAENLFWHWKLKPGRPPIPAELRRLIREISRDNSLWGEE